MVFQSKGGSVSSLPLVGPFTASDLICNAMVYDVTLVS